LKTRNGNIRSTWKKSTPKTEEGYCNKANQSGPLIHNKKPPSPTYSGTYKGKTTKGLDKTGDTISDMVLHVLQIALYRKITKNCMKYGDNVIHNAE
jgi:hypothetical protein